VEKYGRTRQATDDNIIQRMRFACWITKATDTHSPEGSIEIYHFLPVALWPWDRLNLYQKWLPEVAPGG
jgi:hypothetical protein